MNIFEDTSSSTVRERPLRVALLGCSGSIGTQTLDVIRMHPDKLALTAVAVNSSAAKLVSVACEFGVAHAAIADEARRNDPALAELPQGCELDFGEDAVTRLATLPDVDCVLVAVVGEAGIWASHAALAAGKIWAPANKEALVIGGGLLMPLARPGRVLPVDSEHNAIYQCLVGERRRDLRKIWLTCSGGPFFGRTREQLEGVTAAEALAHPTWKMGAKITIDCATLMNKGLEVIEAHHLFDVAIDDVEVLVHRQSKIHSAVEFADGSVKAQLGPSDMRVAIQYALSYPERWDSPATHVDWRSSEPLTFAAPDRGAFRCLDLALEAGRTGGTLPCAMNAANEVANEAFRQDRCGFCDIDRIVERVMDATSVESLTSLEQIAEVDALARERARGFVSELA
ncbi:1-deoxy-D-xylulose-5-phosphate reductoisomerase [uncultured Parolsenella sp.]|uniref:1-deoxy-D-xylulose-5-phosphate reductoisomerase n=1 Tax=uncultured Parolsenella sp. TaxID=2083008 RepID=UPI0025FC5D0E|nr:1-deoxy-D-xylulose-5-phosphate reductoisomerase [uncultured Parolsenella sp.]